jgi:hypothetical protein
MATCSASRFPSFRLSNCLICKPNVDDTCTNTRVGAVTHPRYSRRLEPQPQPWLPDSRSASRLKWWRPQISHIGLDPWADFASSGASRLYMAGSGPRELIRQSPNECIIRSDRAIISYEYNMHGVGAASDPTGVTWNNLRSMRIFFAHAVSVTLLRSRALFCHG